MKCEQAKQLMASVWAGDPAPELREHLSTCAECASEMAHLSILWERLGDIPAPEPSAALTHRWESTFGLAISARRRRVWWPQQPVWQMAVAAACLIVGLAVGTFYPRRSNEIAQLREEVTNTKQLVALSLLQQQSATERLRGVDYTAAMPAMEPEVVSALVQAVDRDPNVNVRLAAIDALTKVSGNSAVRRSLVSSLGMQDSPMVQAALIDYALDARDRDAVGALKHFASRQDLDPFVRQRADRALERLTEYK